MFTPSRALALVLACALARHAPNARDPQDKRALEASAIPELDAPCELLREEFFELDLRTGDESKVVGYAAWRRRSEEVGQVLELEVAFPGESTRVRHVERATHEGSRLVWREWRPGGGRTLIVDWNRNDPELDVIEWGRAEGLRTSLPAPDGALMPLYLLELARHGDVADGSFTCVEPLSRALERSTLTTTLAVRPGAASQLERTVELRSADGTLAGAYTFCGDELLAFRWQAGDLSAHRIPASDFVGALARLERDARATDVTVTER